LVAAVAVAVTAVVVVVAVAGCCSAWRGLLVVATWLPLVWGDEAARR